MEADVTPSRPRSPMPDSRTSSRPTAGMLTVAHKVDVLHRHCAEVGRDPADVEMTALAMVPDDADKDTILRDADALAKAGAQAIVVRSTGSEPSRWLEETWAPVMSDLLAIGG